MTEHIRAIDIEWKFREARSSAELLLLLKRYHTMMEKICWMIIFRSQHFTSKIFEEYKKEIPWKNIATYQDIPEKYLIEFIDEIDLFEVSSFLPLSVAFIKKYYHLLSIDQLIKNDRLSKEAKEYAQKIYEKVKDNPSYHRRWDNNLLENSVFRPKDFQGHYTDYTGETPFPSHTPLKIKSQEVQKQNIITKPRQVSQPKPEKKTPTIETYMGKSKAELKEILAKRNVRVYYHDTLDILRKKCVDSEVN